MIDLEQVKWKFEKIREDLSAFRKKGLDTMVLDMKSIQIPPKIKMAAATQELKDLKVVDELISSLRSEINALADNGMQIARLCELRIIQTKEALGRNNFELASIYYNQLREYYPRLTDEAKVEMKALIADIVKRMMDRRKSMGEKDINSDKVKK